MRTFVEIVFDSVYRRELFEPIRDDFIRWYSFAWDHPMVREDLSDRNLPQLTYQAGRQAIKFDPENVFLDAMELFDLMREQISTLLNYIKVIALILVAASGYSFTVDVSVAVPGVFGALAVAFMTPPALYFVFRHQIKSNVELIRQFNEKLVKLDLEIWTNRNPRHRTGYYLWNRTLNSSKAVPILMLLAIVRGLSPRIYGHVSESMRRNMTEYIEEGVWDVSKREFREKALALQGSPNENESVETSPS